MKTLFILIALFVSGCGAAPSVPTNGGFAEISAITTVSPRYIETLSRCGWDFIRLNSGAIAYDRTTHVVPDGVYANSACYFTVSNQSQTISEERATP